ncbi:MAG TPA: hypothetical protein VEJ84_04580, partial [Acidimicrobiales bacterium]|nr:hypothetical protein [Acidimicrobiales bacterium]
MGRWFEPHGVIPGAQVAPLEEYGELVGRVLELEGSGDPFVAEAYPHFAVRVRFELVLVNLFDETGDGGVEAQVRAALGFRALG